MFGLELFDFIIIAIGVAIAAAWLFFYLRGKKNEAFFAPLQESDFPLKEVYFVGFALLEFFGYDYKTKAARKMRKNLEIIYTEQYADYYLRVIYAQKFTLAFTVLNFAVPLYCLGDDVTLLALVLLFVWAAYTYYGQKPEKMMAERCENMMVDFSEMVSKLALLVNAGMILREAWEKVAYTGKTELYLEMQHSVLEMNNGMSEQDAIFNFGQRSMILEGKKFASTMIQGITKGNSELSGMLRAQSKEMWDAKKQSVRRQGEYANTKLLFPICITFIGILIMVVVPIFANLGV